jgi:hypothetical protein
MTYARSRLWTGISAVGSLVVLSTAALALRLTSLLPQAPQTLLVDAAWVATILAVYTVIHWPFDFVGGYHLPCKFGRICHLLPAFVWATARATAVQIGVLTACATALMAAGREQGRLGAVGAAAILMLLLVTFQLPIAQAVGGLHLARPNLAAIEQELRRLGVQPPEIAVLAGIDLGFSGGITGLPGMTRVVIPAHWLKNLSAEAIAGEIVRRMGAVETGARTRGLILAMTWNLAGLWVASGMPGAGFGSLAQFFTTVCWFNLWSFLGLLLLPSLSRPAVIELDRYARSKGVASETVSRIASDLDQLQDDEPVRGAGVETVFHPIPSVSRRQQALQAGDSSRGAWHGARMALYLSWGCFGLLGRAVHCNSGRPELWVMLPAD